MNQTIATEMLNNGTTDFRRSVTGEPRAPLCGMGVCAECRVTIDGRVQLSCQVETEHRTKSKEHSKDQRPTTKERLYPEPVEGLPITREFDLVVVGMGAGGLAAAVQAVDSGMSIALLDDNPLAGGQIWRGATGQTQTLLAQLQRPNVTIINQARVVAVDERRLLVETPDSADWLNFKQLILATGARELFLPFQGWTLPNLMGVGGLQALVKSGLNIAGKKVIVAGSGALLLAVAALLQSKGADVRLIAEQTSWRKLARFGMQIARDPAKLTQSLEFGLTLRRVRFKANCWVTAAHGDDVLRSVSLTDGTKTWREACDYLACGWGLVPNLELASMLGCKLEHGFVQVDSTQQTSINNVYAVGEITGIGGVDKALIEGAIAGLCVSNRQREASRLLAKRRKWRDFASLLQNTFMLRDEIKYLATDQTIVCRCEDVTYGELSQHATWRSAKLHTRCGMGACQAKICGGATQFLWGWTQDSVRPPLAMARVGSIGKSQKSKIKNQNEE